MTEYEKWVVARFGGPRPQDGIRSYLDEVLRSARQVEFPIQLATVASQVGLNPIPIYKRLPVMGCLMPIDSILRIALNRPSGKPITKETRDLGRFRFTYAHEVAHSLAFDLKARPNVRLAPLPTAAEEERLCNRAARHILLPPSILKAESLAASARDAHWLDAIAKKANVSFQPLAMQLCEEKVLPVSKEEICLLSRIGYGSDGKGVEKPRCIAGAYTDARGNHHRLLGPNEGLDRITLPKRGAPRWSLIAFHEKIRSGAYGLNVEVEEEELDLLDKTHVRFFGRHEQVHGMGYVWTTGRLEPVSD